MTRRRNHEHSDTFVRYRHFADAEVDMSPIPGKDELQGDEAAVVKRLRAAPWLQVKMKRHRMLFVRRMVCSISILLSKIQHLSAMHSHPGGE
jgi:hypothetical protein